MPDILTIANTSYREGVAFHRRGNFQDALRCYLEALRLQPECSITLLAIGAALHDLERYVEALTVYQRILDSGGGGATAPLWHNRGNTLLALGRFREAIESYRQAIAVDPADVEALVTMGTAFEQLGEYSQAFFCYEEALARKPDCAVAHTNLALALLRRGEYRRGWSEYEWRGQRRDLTGQSRQYAKPLWDGTRLHGATVLIHAEQGFGDAIQLVRYAPMVAARGGLVIIECHPQLVSLFSQIAGVQAVCHFGSELPPYDCHLPMFSLPRVFQTTLETIPRQVPYLTVAPERAAHWRMRLSAVNEFKVGLVWAGSKQHRNDAFRSLQLADLYPILNMRTVSLFSLQVGPAQTDLAASPWRDQITDLTGEIRDFADTAAVIEQLDLVISADTAVAHLSGALGKPIWTLLPYVPDWRWLLEREDSPWYPTMRLFRQTERGSWAGPVARIASALAQVSVQSRTADKI